MKSLLRKINNSFWHGKLGKFYDYTVIAIVILGWAIMFLATLDIFRYLKIK
jgi:hypothetical protein